MKQEETQQSIHALLNDLKACTARRDLKWGRRIHMKAEKENWSSLFVATALIKMYAKCGSMVDARRVFDSIQKPDVVAWTSLLSGYAENGEGHVSLKLFSRMKADGCMPNPVTYVAALKACTSLAVEGEKEHGLEMGREIHLQTGSNLDLYVQNTLIDMYAKCGSMVDAHHVFSRIEQPDVVAWSALLLGYAENGDGYASLEVFSKMKANGCSPNSVTYVAALKACSCLAVNADGSGKCEGLEMGIQIHWEIGQCVNPYVQSMLIDMYARCGSMVDSRHAFETTQKSDVVCWTALLLGYAENGEGYISLELFSQMKAAGCVPNSVTFVAALKACTSLAVNEDAIGKAHIREVGREIHREIGRHVDLYVQSTLIDMYSKCGSMVDARQVFRSIPKPDVVSWNVLLLGYAENGEGHVSLDLFSKMKADGCHPDSVTYVAVMKSCGSVGALALGRKFHSMVTEFTVQVVTSLVDFYARCGSMVEARAVFDLHTRARDVATWSVLLAGYSSCGDTDSVFSLFKLMQEMGYRPDGITFLSVLVCCSHAGLVGKARECLEAMPVKYGVTPEIVHYNCLVDVLGRANQLLEAVSVLRGMPCSPNAVTWIALLASCCKWKNVEVGRMAFQCLVEMGNGDASAYVLMARLYGNRGMWQEQARVLEFRPECRALSRTKQLRLPACTGEKDRTCGSDVELSMLGIDGR